MRLGSSGQTSGQPEPWLCGFRFGSKLMAGTVLGDFVDFRRATVSQTVHVDVAPLRPFASFIFCRATVSQTVHVIQKTPQRDPTGAPRRPKGPQRTAKGSPRAPQREPKGGQGGPELYIQTPDQPPKRPLCYWIHMDS